MKAIELVVIGSGIALALGCASTPRAASQSDARDSASPQQAAAAPVSAAPTPAEEPPAETSDSDVAPSEPEPAPAPAPDAEASAPVSEEEKPSSSPQAVLTAAEVAFIIDYARSGPRLTDEKACEAEAQGDPALRAACMSKARDAFSADVLRFKKDQAGKWWLYTYKRKGQSLSEVHSMLVDFSGETERSVIVKAKGREQGTRVLFKGASELLFNVPNDYSIRLEDPKLGVLIYDAKVGLVGR